MRVGYYISLTKPTTKCFLLAELNMSTFGVEINKLQLVKSTFTSIKKNFEPLYREVLWL